MADIQRYLDEIESQHKTKPKYMAMVKAMLEKVDDCTSCVRDMPKAFSIDQAEGAQLDVLGQFQCIDRQVVQTGIPGESDLLDDATYRQLIQAAVVRNRWDGRMESLPEIWKTAFGDDLVLHIHDNQDLTMDVTVIGEVSPLLMELILRGYVLPKPMGVGMNISIVQPAVAEGDLTPMYVGAILHGQSGRMNIPMEQEG